MPGTRETYDLVIAAAGAGLAAAFLVDLAVGTGATVPAELSPYWSLGVEEHFYLVWPLVVAAGLHRGGAWFGGLVRAVLVGTVLLGLFSPLLPQVLPVDPYFLPTTWCYALVAGALVAVGLALPRGRGVLACTVRAAGRRWAVPVGFLVLTPAFLAADDFNRPNQGLVFAPLQAAALAFLLLAVLVREPGAPAHRVLSVAPLQWLGTISYGLYLVNDPVIVFSSGWWGGSPWVRGLAALVAVGLAWAVRRWVEEPALRLKDRVGHPRGDRDVRHPEPIRTADPVATPAS